MFWKNEQPVLDFHTLSSQKSSVVRKRNMAPESDSFWSGDVIFHFTKGKGIISKIIASKTKAFIFSPTA